MYCERPVAYYTGWGCSIDFRAPTKSVEQSRAFFGSHPPLASQAGLFAKPTTRDKKNCRVTEKEKQRSFDSETERNRKLCEVQASAVGPMTTLVVIALRDLTREVNSLRWVIGLSFRLSEAIPQSSFLSELASQTPLRTGRKWLKIRTVSGPKYTDQMGPLRWQPE